MELYFIITALVVLASATAAMTLRRLVHCALCLTLTFVGLAALFLQLHAEFVAFAQILVYVGAVAMVILFAILLTRSPEDQDASSPYFSPGWGAGLLAAAAVFVVLAAAIGSSPLSSREAPALPEITVRRIGEQLLHRPDGHPDNYLLPLLVTGLLLTAAMIGAVILAMPERKKD